MNDGAKEAIKHGLAKAQKEGHCVLEFKERDDGTMMVMEITEHLNQLERIAENE